MTDFTNQHLFQLVFDMTFPLYLRKLLIYAEIFIGVYDLSRTL
jgi:hypothetical protein